jgi:heptosyltransferase-2
VDVQRNGESFEPADPRSILVVLPTWVGDFVMATPALRAIRDRFRRAHITFLMEPNLRGLVDGGEWMDECVEWPSKERRTPLHKEYHLVVSELRRRGFDWAVLLPNSFRSALLARLAGARRRIGYDRDGRGLLLTDRIPVKNRRPRGGASSTDGHEVGQVGSAQATALQEGRPGSNLPVPPERFIPTPIVDYYADLVEAIGCERPGDRLELFTTPECDRAVDERLRALGIAGRQPLVVISPGARYGASKCWLPDRFAGVANRVVDAMDAVVIVTCGPGEEQIARLIGSYIRRQGFVFDNPRTTLGELKSLIRRCDLLICNDAGPRHLAKAFGIPVVTVFGPTHPEWTATSYPKERIVRIDVDCGPCQQRLCPLGHLKCMTGVTVEAVFVAAEELLQGRTAGVPHER